MIKAGAGLNEDKGNGGSRGDIVMPGGFANGRAKANTGREVILRGGDCKSGTHARMANVVYLTRLDLTFKFKSREGQWWFCDGFKWIHQRWFIRQDPHRAIAPESEWSQRQCVSLVGQI